MLFRSVVEIVTEEELPKVHSPEDSNFDGTKSAMDGAGHVRGTRIPFPADGPTSRYAALFDKRPCFDALRESFMVTNDRRSKPDAFLAGL